MRSLSNYLTSRGGITGNVTASDVSPYVSLAAVTEGNNGYVTASQKQTLGHLPGMTPSEQSVGAALNQLAVQAVAAAAEVGGNGAVTAEFVPSNSTQPRLPATVVAFFFRGTV